jgi:SAM-dependent methyltransferase
METELYEQIAQIEDTHWWYVARRKIIFDWVFKILKDYATPTIADIGCGTGRNIAELLNNGCHDIWGVDISLNALGHCKARNLKNLICADAAHSPFGPEQFDIIMLLDMIEHIENDQKTLNEVFDALRANGRVVIFTPAFQFLWGLQDRVAHHYRRYSKTELRQKLEQAGFVIEKLSFANTFLFPVVFLGRLWIKMRNYKVNVISENDLHPPFLNGLLEKTFSAERRFLRTIDFPFGVSLLCIAKKPELMGTD